MEEKMNLNGTIEDDPQWVKDLLNTLPSSIDEDEEEIDAFLKCIESREKYVICKFQEADMKKLLELISRNGGDKTKEFRKLQDQYRLLLERSANVFIEKSADEDALFSALEKEGGLKRQAEFYKTQQYKDLKKIDELIERLTE